MVPSLNRFIRDSFDVKKIENPKSAFFKQSQKTEKSNSFISPMIFLEFRLLDVDQNSLINTMMTVNPFEPYC